MNKNGIDGKKGAGLGIIYMAIKIEYKYEGRLSLNFFSPYR
jgi:hypothetical protein|tara:strand:- start:354 stop:476 length:123 start_codon:yes stop_codon:yes gene_type:complete